MSSFLCANKNCKQRCCNFYGQCPDHTSKDLSRSSCIYNYDRNDYETLCKEKQCSEGCCTLTGKCRNSKSLVPEQNTCVYYKKNLLPVTNCKDLTCQSGCCNIYGYCPDSTKQVSQYNQCYIYYQQEYNTLKLSLTNPFVIISIILFLFLSTLIFICYRRYKKLKLIQFQMTTDNVPKSMNPVSEDENTSKIKDIMPFVSQLSRQEPGAQQNIKKIIKQQHQQTSHTISKKTQEQNNSQLKQPSQMISQAEYNMQSRINVEVSQSNEFD